MADNYERFSQIVTQKWALLAILSRSLSCRQVCVNLIKIEDCLKLNFVKNSVIFNKCFFCEK